MKPLKLFSVFCLLMVLSLVAAAAFPLSVSADEPTPPPTDLPTNTPTEFPTQEPTLEPTATEELPPTLEATTTVQIPPTLEPSATPEPSLEPSATLEPTFTATATLLPTATLIPPSSTASSTATSAPAAEEDRQPEPTVEAPSPTAIPEADLPAVIGNAVQTASDTGIILADMTGDPLNMGSQDAAQAIAEGDPYFTSGGTLYSFTFGDCDPVTPGAQPCGNPIQAALDFSVTNPPDSILAPDGQIRQTIFVEPGTYAAEITINTPGITLWGNPGNRFVAGADPSAPVLDGSSLAGITTAITINAEGFTLIGFIIQNYTTAIYQPVILGTLDITISNNTIRNNVNGIVVEGAIGHPRTEAHFNVFRDNLENDLVSGPPDANNVRFLNAQRNFWGCDSGPVIRYKHMVGGVWDGSWGYVDWGTQHDYGLNGDGDDPNPDCAVIYGPDKLWNFKTAGGANAPYKVGIGPFLVSTSTPTQSGGATSTATFTPTDTPTYTPTNTPTDIPTNTPTLLVEATATFMPTSTPTAAGGNNPTPTATSGSNGGGQGSTVSSLPTLVIPVTGGRAHAIAAGNAHTCAIISGSVKCWGDNTYGQLGDGSGTGSSSPVDVSGLEEAVSLAAGGDHTCALAGGEVWCWGRNDHGQIGDGFRTDRTTPVKVLNGAVAITAGFDYSCAILASGQVICWGANDRGQLADGTHTDQLRPTLASLIGGVSSLDAGQSGLCGISPAGPRCVIDGNARLVTGIPAGILDLSVGRFAPGILALDGRGTAFIQSGPSFSQVPDLSGVLDIDSGQDYTCALLDDGTVQCWGSNTYGQLGNGSTNSSSTPQPVSDLKDAWQLAVGRSHACALVGSTDADPGILCWGLNQDGQLGSGNYQDVSVPAVVQ